MMSATPTIAAKLRALADGMQATIDDKLRTRPEHTRRMANMADGMRRDGYKLQDTQTALYALAHAHDTGTVPSDLAYITTKTAVESLLHGYSPSIGYNGDTAPAKVLKTLFTDWIAQGLQPDKPSNPTREQAELNARVKAAARQGIPGYFPTPPALIADMLECASLCPGMVVIEPSAGAGHIADAIRAEVPSIIVEVCEINNDLRKILEDKGHRVCKPNDFMSWADTTICDRVIMNPPFENGQDIDHVQHAYKMLKPDGRLIAIMCEGPFFRGDKKSVDFRAWLSSVCGTSKKNPDNSFKTSDNPTGVATRLVVIDKAKSGSTPAPATIQTPGIVPATERVKQMEPAIPEQPRQHTRKPHRETALCADRLRLIDGQMPVCPPDADASKQKEIALKRALVAIGHTAHLALPDVMERKTPPSVSFGGKAMIKLDPAPILDPPINPEWTEAHSIDIAIGEALLKGAMRYTTQQVQIEPAMQQTPGFVESFAACEVYAARARVAKVAPGFLPYMDARAAYSAPSPVILSKLAAADAPQEQADRLQIASRLLVHALTQTDPLTDGYGAYTPFVARGIEAAQQRTTTQRINRLERLFQQETHLLPEPPPPAPTPEPQPEQDDTDDTDTDEDTNENEPEQNEPEESDSDSDGEDSDQQDEGGHADDEDDTTEEDNDAEGTGNNPDKTKDTDAEQGDDSDEDGEEDQDGDPSDDGQGDTSDQGKEDGTGDEQDGDGEPTDADLSDSDNDADADGDDSDTSDDGSAEQGDDSDGDGDENTEGESSLGGLLNLGGQMGSDGDKPELPDEEPVPTVTLGADGDVETEEEEKENAAKPWIEKGHGWEPVFNRAEEHSVDPVKYAEIARSATPQINALRARLAFRATRATGNEIGYSTGNVDTHALHKLVQGLPGSHRAFTRPNVETLPSVSISLLIDLSGSMNTNNYDWPDARYVHGGPDAKIHGARKVAAMIAEATKGLKGVDLSITGYHGAVGFGYSNGDMTTHVVFTHAIAPQDIQVKREAITGLTPTGYTPTPGAIGEYSKLLESAYPRQTHALRILYVLTDGMTDSHYNCKEQETKYQVDQAIKNGTEVYGIGIGNAYTEKVGKAMFGENRSIVLSDVDSAGVIIGAHLTRELRRLKA